MASNGWKNAAGKLSANPDLWQELSKLMGRYAEGGCEISFWAILREWNTRVDAAECLHIGRSREICKDLSNLRLRGLPQALVSISVLSRVQ